MARTVCPICWDFLPALTTECSSCKQLFCYECIQTWLKIKIRQLPACPLCREPLSPPVTIIFDNDNIQTSHNHLLLIMQLGNVVLEFIIPRNLDDAKDIQIVQCQQDMRNGSVNRPKRQGTNTSELKIKTCHVEKDIVSLKRDLVESLKKIDAEVKESFEFLFQIKNRNKRHQHIQ